METNPDIKTLRNEILEILHRTEEETIPLKDRHIPIPLSENIYIHSISKGHTDGEITVNLYLTKTGKEDTSRTIHSGTFDALVAASSVFDNGESLKSILEALNDYEAELKTAEAIREIITNAVRNLGDGERLTFNVNSKDGYCAYGVEKVRILDSLNIAVGMIGTSRFGLFDLEGDDSYDESDTIDRISEWLGADIESAVGEDFTVEVLK